MVGARDTTFGKPRAEKHTQADTNNAGLHVKTHGPRIIGTRKQKEED